MKANSNPITKNVATKPNIVIWVVVHPVVFASLIEVIPTVANAPTTTRAITDPIIVLILTIDIHFLSTQSVIIMTYNLI